MPVANYRLLGFLWHHLAFQFLLPGTHRLWRNYSSAQTAYRCQRGAYVIRTLLILVLLLPGNDCEGLKYTEAGERNPLLQNPQ